MPFKSEAQRKKFGALLSAGKITQAQFDEWTRDTPSSLPDRVKKTHSAPTKKYVKYKMKIKHMF